MGDMLSSVKAMTVANKDETPNFIPGRVIENGVTLEDFMRLTGPDEYGIYHSTETLKMYRDNKRTFYSLRGEHVSDGQLCKDWVELSLSSALTVNKNMSDRAKIDIIRRLPDGFPYCGTAVDAVCEGINISMLIDDLSEDSHVLMNMSLDMFQFIITLSVMNISVRSCMDAYERFKGSHYDLASLLRRGFSLDTLIENNVNATGVRSIIGLLELGTWKDYLYPFVNYRDFSDRLKIISEIHDAVGDVSWLRYDVDYECVYHLRNIINQIGYVPEELKNVELTRSLIEDWCVTNLP